MKSRPLWSLCKERARSWEKLGASAYLCRAIKFGIYEAPTVPFTLGEVLPEIPQTTEDLEFAEEVLDKGCREGVYEEVSCEVAMEAVARGNILSSAFVVWQDKESKTPKPRLV